MTLFRQNLRRSLLNSGRYARDSFKSHGLLFFAPTALAVFLAIIIVAFVLNPKIPSNFHNSISSGRYSLNIKQPEVQQNETVNVHLNSNLANWVEQYHQSTEADLDEVVVRYLAQEQHQFDPGTIQPVGKTRLLAIRQYQTPNGQNILIFTQIPDDQISYFRAY